MDKEKMDEERRRRHERRRERKEREAKEGKSKDSSKQSARPKKAHGLDIIDKLDVTGIYGQGCEYHHCKWSMFSDSISSFPPRWTI